MTSVLNLTNDLMAEQANPHSYIPKSSGKYFLKSGHNNSKAEDQHCFNAYASEMDMYGCAVGVSDIVSKLHHNISRKSAIMLLLMI